MIALLAIYHKFQLRELLRNGQHFLLIHLFVASLKTWLALLPSWLLLLVERVLAEA